MSAVSRDERNRRVLSVDELSGLAGRAAKGGAIALSAQFVRIVLQIGGIAILSRLLEPADFGLIAMAAAVTGFITLFSDLGLGVAVVQRKTLSQETVSSLFFVNLAVGAALMLVAIAAAPLASIFFGDPRLSLLIGGLALAIPLTAAAGLHGAILARTMRWVPIHVIAIGSQAGGLAAAVLLALLTDMGYLALLAQVLVAAALGLLLSWAACEWRPSFYWNWRNAKAEIQFGLFVTGFNFLNYFHRQFDNVLVGWRWGSVELGFYSRAYNLLTLPISIINSSVSQAAVPALSRLADLPEAWRSAFLKLLTISAFGGLGLCAVLFAVAEPLIYVLLGKQWGDAVPIFRALLLSSAFATATNPMGWAFISLGRTREYFRWSLFASPLFVLSFAAGLPWGGVGVALAYSAAMAVLAPLYAAYTAKHSGIQLRAISSRLVPIVLLAIAVALVSDQALGATGLEGDLARLVVGCFIAGALYVFAALCAVLVLPQYREVRRMLERVRQTRSFSLS